MKLLIILNLIFVFTSGLEFHEWCDQYNKSFLPEEYSLRKAVFEENRDFVNRHTNPDFQLSLNKFAHLTLNEFRAQYTGTFFERHVMHFVDEDSVEIPTSIDWVERGGVTPVKDQGGCGSCWAFSTTGSIEGAWFIAHDELVSLSEQELVDCSHNDGNEGCNGGSMDSAYEWIIAHGGICGENSYPYHGHDTAVCKRCTAVVKITSWADVRPNNETALLIATARQPIAVAVEADSNWQFYAGGILTERCGANVDHGVLLVGYSPIAWRIKNSWGVDWGEAGYIRLARGSHYKPHGQCGILLEPMFPIV